MANVTGPNRSNSEPEPEPVGTGKTKKKHYKSFAIQVFKHVQVLMFSDFRNFFKTNFHYNPTVESAELSRFWQHNSDSDRSGSSPQLVMFSVTPAAAWFIEPNPYIV